MKHSYGIYNIYRELVDKYSLDIIEGECFIDKEFLNYEDIYKMTTAFLYELNDETKDLYKGDTRTWRKYKNVFWEAFNIVDYPRGQIPMVVGILMTFLFLLKDGKYTELDECTAVITKLTVTKLKHGNIGSLTTEEKHSIVDYLDFMNNFCMYSKFGIRWDIIFQKGNKTITVNAYAKTSKKESKGDNHKLKFINNQFCIEDKNKFVCCQRELQQFAFFNKYYDELDSAISTLRYNTGLSAKIEDAETLLEDEVDSETKKLKDNIRAEMEELHPRFEFFDQHSNTLTFETLDTIVEAISEKSLQKFAKQSDDMIKEIIANYYSIPLF